MPALTDPVASIVRLPERLARDVLTVSMLPSCMFAPESVIFRLGATIVVVGSFMMMSPISSPSASALKMISPPPGAKDSTLSFSGAIVILLLASSVTFVSPDRDSSVSSASVKSPASPLEFESGSNTLPSKICSLSGAAAPLTI